MLRGSLATAWCLLAVATARAAPGDLDPTFGSNGVVVSSFGSNDVAIATSLAIQPDGKILAGGFIKADFPFQAPGVARYHSDGTLDSGFGVGGFVTTPALTKSNVFQVLGSPTKTGIALEPSGKIVFGAAGGSPYFFDRVYAIFRFDPDGGPDTSFDNDGCRLMTLGTSSGRFGGVARQPDGKILFAGESNGMNVIRLQANGTWDYGFGAGGVALAVPKPQINSSAPNAILLQPDGKIIAGGYTWDGTNQTAALGRVLGNGAPDPTFGAEGKVITYFGAESYITALAREADGKFVAAGHVRTETGFDILLMRHEPDGSLDASFGSNGVVSTAVGVSNDTASAVALQADGKIVVGGSIQTGGVYDSLLLRYHTNGVLDTAFGSNGVVVTAISPGRENATDLTIQPDGKIVTVGYAALEPSNHFALARYESGLGPEPEIEVNGPSDTPLTHTQSAIDLGSLAPGLTNTVTLRIRNGGHTNLTGLAASIHGTDAADFDATQPPVTELLPASNIAFTVTFIAGPTGHRTATLRIASSDLDENPFEVTLAGRSLSAMEQWRQVHFGSPDDAGEGADTHDCEPDGAPNLLEFATDGNPHVYGPIPTTLTAHRESLLFTYTRNKDAVAELSFIVEWSDSLLPDDWHTNDVVSVIMIGSGPTERVLASMPAGPDPARFVRLRVTRP